MNDVDTPDIQGILGGPLIHELREDIFAAEYSPECVRAASYDVRIAATKMILPDGTRVPEGQTRDHNFYLRPGEVAFVSSRERFHIPSSLSANISIRFSYSAQGMLILSGMLVDPGYGTDDSNGARLHFLVANVGSERILIRPGIDRIAAVQFIPVSVGNGTLPVGTATPKATPMVDALFANPDQKIGLEFFTTQALLQNRVKDMEDQVNDSVRGLTQIVIFGIFLLSTAIIGVILTILLGWMSDGTISNRIDSLSKALPQTSWGTLSFGLLLIAVLIVLPFLLVKVTPKVLKTYFSLKNRGGRDLDSSLPGYHDSGGLA